MAFPGNKNPRMGKTKLGIFKNKYVVATFLFVVWVSFFDQNNLVERFQNKKELKQLQEDKIYYQDKIKETAERLNELKTNKENLEKFEGGLIGLR